jgi:hypothetical protein
LIKLLKFNKPIGGKKMSKRAVNVLRQMGIPYKFDQDQTFTGVVTHTNASGKYINGRNTVVKVSGPASGSAELVSGPIYHPANSVIRGITVVVTTVLDKSGTANVGVRAGTALGNATYCVLDVDSLQSGGGTTAAGVGTSSDSALTTDLGGNAALALSNLYVAAAGEIHVEVQPASGTITTGEVAFIVEFDYLGGN